MRPAGAAQNNPLSRRSPKQTNALQMRANLFPELSTPSRETFGKVKFEEVPAFGHGLRNEFGCRSGMVFGARFTLFPERLVSNRKGQLKQGFV